MDAQVIHPRVGDQEAGRWMTPGESEHVIRAMMLVLIDSREATPSRGS